MILPVRKTLPLPEGEISCLDWEGESPRPLLHFSHATGFNGETYKGLLAPLADRLRIVASDLRGHGLSTLPTRPGLGVDINEAALKKYPFQGTRPFPPAFHDDGSVASL